MDISANVEATQWIIFSILGLIVFCANVPNWYCLGDWVTRHRTVLKDYDGFIFVDYYYYVVVWFVGLALSVVANGLVWTNSVQNDNQTNLLLGATICILVSYLFASFWSYQFFKKMMPPVLDPEKAAEAFNQTALAYASYTILIATIAAIIALILEAIINPFGWFMIGYIVCLLLIGYSTWSLYIKERQGESTNTTETES